MTTDLEFLSKCVFEFFSQLQSGKTLLANFLSDATENPSEDYRPTHVVRILEFESVSSGEVSGRGATPGPGVAPPPGVWSQSYECDLQRHE
jgi:hypothetical protein